MTAFTGDFAKLGLLQANMQRLSGVPSRTAKRVANELRDSIRHEFEAGEDPYGKAWADLMPSTIAKGRHAPPLTDSGKMVDSLDVRPTQGSGIAISFGAEYAGFHQGGTRFMQARPPLPSAGFPAGWSDIIREAATDEFQEPFK